MRWIAFFSLIVGGTLACTGKEQSDEPANAARAESDAQSPDIFLGSLAFDGSTIVMDGLHNVTDRDGYDNQPHFTSDGSGFYYTVVDTAGRADIYRYDVAREESSQVTVTIESEYSATPMPDGAHISLIRVERDSTQRLWRFTRDGEDPAVLLDSIFPVGYHAWGDSTTIALFVLGTPPTLQLADTRNGTAEIIESNIGRSLHRIPGRHAISFVHKQSDTEWWIKELDLDTREISPLVKTLSGSEDYAWHPGGGVLMGSGTVMYWWEPGATGWVKVADLAPQGLGNITRIAVSPDGERIAIVADVAH